MRDVMAAAAQDDRTDPRAAARVHGGAKLLRSAKSGGHHSAEADARQVQFHYDVSDDFYALWLDARASTRAPTTATPACRWRRRRRPSSTMCAAS